MEIISPRTDSKKQITCPHCGAVIAYYRTEEQVSHIGRFIYRDIKCPSCSLLINLKMTNLMADDARNPKDGLLMRLCKWLGSPSNSSSHGPF